MPKCQRMPFFLLSYLFCRPWHQKVELQLPFLLDYSTIVIEIGFLTLDDFFEKTSNSKTQSTACINGELQRALRDQSNIYKFAFLSNETLEFDAISTVQQCFAILYVFCDLIKNVARARKKCDLGWLEVINRLKFVNKIFVSINLRLSWVSRKILDGSFSSFFEFGVFFSSNLNSQSSLWSVFVFGISSKYFPYPLSRCRCSGWRNCSGQRPPMIKIHFNSSLSYI